MAKYKEVADDLKRRIDRREFIENKLPIEDELIEYYEVSRNTIRSAIKLLINEGKVYSRQGSGMYIREMNIPNCISITGTNGLAHDFPNSTFETKVISLEIIHADKALAERMMCEIGTPVYEVYRLRIIDGKKFAMEHTLYNKNIVPYLGKEIAEKSIYSYLQNDLKLKFGFADKHIYAIKLPEKFAKYLELNTGDPGLVIEDRVYLDNGELFNVSEVTYNYKYANFYAAATR